MSAGSIFAATEPTLGYLYQIRYGLMLITSETNEESKLLLERIDDISIDSPNSLDVYQTKFHLNSAPNLTNASVDFWKTIRVWCEGIKDGSIDIKNCVFNLVTTANTSVGTIPFQLKQGTQSSRNIQQILDEMLAVCTTSENATNASAYASFQSLSEDLQKELIQKIIVTDASVDHNESKNKILHELRNSTLMKEALFERLEGWFLNEIILQLQNKRNEITFKEVNLKILDIADSLKADNLPNDFSVAISNDDEQLETYRNYTFVRQLELIDTNQRVINHAISDYYRAFSQKSKWIREGLISPQDEIAYHLKLQDDWDRKFSIISDSSHDEDMQKLSGRNFYESHYINQCPQIFIKDRFKENYMVTGCCHDLSDKKDIGWHPDYKNKV